jgi:hypothetical protein
MGSFRAPREAGDGRRPPRVIIKESECPVQETYETGEERDARIDREEMARPGNGCKLSLAMVDDYADMGAHLVRLAQPSAKGTNVTAPSSVPSAMPTARRGYADMGANLPSPSLSEFENYLDEREANLQPKTIKKGSDKHVGYERPPNVSNTEWWESVLAAEKERCEQDTRSRTIAVADILLHDALADVK